MNKFFAKAMLAAALVGLGAIIVPVAPVIAQAVTSLSSQDKAIMTATRDAVQQLAALIDTGLFKVSVENTQVPTTILDENGNPVVWAASGTGLLQSAATVTGTAAVCYAADTTARERMIKSLPANTADIHFALDTDGSPTLTASNAPKTLHPGDEWTTGQNGYTGNIYCISASGSQTLAKNTVN